MKNPPVSSLNSHFHRYLSKMTKFRIMCFQFTMPTQKAQGFLVSIPNEEWSIFQLKHRFLIRISRGRVEH